jgi:hypothetical protein
MGEVSCAMALSPRRALRYKAEVGLVAARAFAARAAVFAQVKGEAFDVQRSSDGDSDSWVFVDFERLRRP